MPAKLATTNQLRQYNVCNPTASARIEGITLTKQFEEKLTGYVYGKKKYCSINRRTKQSYIKSSIK
jgi:hypothetical protein